MSQSRRRRLRHTACLLFNARRGGKIFTSLNHELMNWRVVKTFRYATQSNQMNDNTQFECCGKPEGLLNYFERLAAENGREEFLRGAARTREWIGMMTSDTVTQDGFDENTSAG